MRSWSDQCSSRKLSRPHFCTVSPPQRRIHETPSLGQTPPRPGRRRRARNVGHELQQQLKQNRNVPSWVQRTRRIHPGVRRDAMVFVKRQHTTVAADGTVSIDVAAATARSSTTSATCPAAAFSCCSRHDRRDAHQPHRRSSHGGHRGARRLVQRSRHRLLDEEERRRPLPHLHREHASVRPTRRRSATATTSTPSTSPATASSS